MFTELNIDARGTWRVALSPRMKLSDLPGHPDNPRKISEEQLKMLKASLEEFGDLSGIVFNEADRMLIGAHQRLKVLPPDAEVIIDDRLGTPTRCGTTAYGYTIVDGEKFSVRIVAWGPEKAKAANIAANKHGGEFDLPKLADWLLDLDSKNIDMNLTGFTPLELEELCAPFRTMPEGDPTKSHPRQPSPTSNAATCSYSAITASYAAIAR